tara:strand:+ start:939 stop:1193 length:255 start_codon:yes stop_codon:yes gene_type:complete
MGDGSEISGTREDSPGTATIVFSEAIHNGQTGIFSEASASNTGLDFLIDVLGEAMAVVTDAKGLPTYAGLIYVWEFQFYFLEDR